MYTLKINGNTLAEKFSINGNNYVSATEVETSDWPPIFSLTATDSEGNVVERIEHAKLIQQLQYAWDNNKFYLAFAPVSQQELINAEKEAKITDIEETAADLFEENIAHDEQITALEEMVAELYEGSVE